MVWNDFNPRSRQGFLKVGSISSLATILWHPINIALGPFIPIAAGSGWVSWGLPAGCKVLRREPEGKRAGSCLLGPWSLPCACRVPSQPLAAQVSNCKVCQPEAATWGCQGNYSLLFSGGNWQLVCSGWVCGGQGMFEWGCPSHQQSWRGAPRMSPCTTELGPSEGGSWTQKTGQRE